MIPGKHKILSWLGRKWGFTVRRIQHGYDDWDDPALSHMITEKYVNRQKDELSEVVHQTLEPLLVGFDTSRNVIRKLIDAFYRVYAQRPFTENRGGSSFHNSLWLYVIARIMRPELIVESGVWKGMSSFMLASACPEARIHGFDISLERLIHRHEDVTYHEQDWADFDFGSVHAARSLCFFDCHVSHAKRIMEARQKGFRFLLLDDNAPAHALYGYSVPAFPTAQMIVDGGFEDGEDIEWRHQGKSYSFSVDLQEMERTRSLIKMHHVLPDLSSMTRYNSRSGAHSFLTWVELA